MATLAGTRVKDTYQGMLKTSDAAALTTSLKVIEDGVGNSSALSLSTTAVKASTLQIDSVTGSSSSGNALVWNSTTKDVEYRAFPSNETVTTTVGGSTAPTITIEAADASSTTVTFTASDGVAYSRSGNTIALKRGGDEIKAITGSTTLTANESGSIYYLTTSSGMTITLPTPVAGTRYTFIVKTVSNPSGQWQITSGSGGYVFGKAEVTSTGAAQSRAQVQATNTSITQAFFQSDDTATGGSVGDVIEVTAVDTANWMVRANLSTSATSVGTVAVFSAP